MEGAAVLNRWSITWKDPSRRGEGEAVGQASARRKGAARRPSRAKALMVCVLLVSEEPQGDHGAGEEYAR